MALPNSINAATPAGTDLKSDGDNQIRALKQFIEDILGIPDNTAISAAPLTINTSGQITALNQINAPLRVGSAADAFLTLGLILDQGANDDYSLLLKSTDVAHAMTTLATAGTYGAAGKVSASTGGLHLRGISDATDQIASLRLSGYAGNPVSGKTQTAAAAVFVSGWRSDGATGAITMASGQNVFGIGNGSTETLLLVDANGAIRVRPGKLGLPNANYDDLVIEGQVGLSAGITLLSSNNATGALAFGDPENNDAGLVRYDHSADEMLISAVGDISLVSGNQINLVSSSTAFGSVSDLTFTAGDTTSFISSGVTSLYLDGAKVFIGDTANAQMTRGLTINMQNATEPAGLALKHTNSAHGITSQTETDTFLEVGWVDGSNKAYIEGFGSSDEALSIIAIGQTGDATKGVASIAPVTITGYKKSGTSFTALTNNENVFVVKNAGTAVMIVDEDGDLHMAGSTSITAFDDHDDVGLLTAARASLMPEHCDFRKRHAEWVARYAPVLAANKIITYNEDGQHFVSQRGMQGLMIDTIRQLAERVEHLEGLMRDTA